MKKVAFMITLVFLVNFLQAGIEEIQHKKYAVLVLDSLPSHAIGYPETLTLLVKNGKWKLFSETGKPIEPTADFIKHEILEVQKFKVRIKNVLLNVKSIRQIPYGAKKKKSRIHRTVLIFKFEQYQMADKELLKRAVEKYFKFFDTLEDAKKYVKRREDIKKIKKGEDWKKRLKKKEDKSSKED